MMDARKQAYLDAMDIPVWVRRQPGAPEAEGSTTAIETVGTRSEAPPIAPSSALEAAPALAEALPAVAELDWEGLAERVTACEQCPELVANRSQTVFGVGDRQADVMVIGEAPGADEDRQGEPFVGRAGKLLDNMLRGIGFPRKSVYIANVLKCRPPNNRDPKAEEAAACAPFLRRQIELVGPKVILVVGRVAAQNLLETDEPTGRLRGRLHRYADTDIPVVVTYHPAYLLRSPGEKRKAWEDLRLLLATYRKRCE